MKVGIFGGTFDPLHNGHNKIIQESLDLLNLDLLVIVPSFNPPHKDSCSASFEDRVNMLLAEYKDNPKIKIETIEKEMGLDVSYTYIVLDFLKAFYGNNLFYIIGADSMIDFSTWKYPEVIAKQATLAVVKRKSYSNLEEAIMLAKSKFKANIVPVEIDVENISSTVLRGKLEVSDETAANFIPRNAYRYLKENNLFENYKTIIEKFRSNVSEKTFEHSISTLLFSLKYASKLKIPFEKAFLASLLHDCAKDITPDTERVASLNTNKEVYHQFLGSDLAKELYKIKDEDILNAIKYHTTGRENMSPLEKLVFVADKLEPFRKYDGIDEIRKKIDQNFNSGFIALLELNFSYLKANVSNIDPRTISTFLWYNQ